MPPRDSGTQWVLVGPGTLWGSGSGLVLFVFAFLGRQTKPEPETELWFGSGSGLLGLLSPFFKDEGLGCGSGSGSDSGLVCLLPAALEKGNVLVLRFWFWFGLPSSPSP